MATIHLNANGSSSLQTIASNQSAIRIEVAGTSVAAWPRKVGYAFSFDNGSTEFRSNYSVDRLGTYDTTKAEVAENLASRINSTYSSIVDATVSGTVVTVQSKSSQLFPVSFWIENEGDPHSSWLYFTTDVDLTSPTLSNSSPANNATSVALDSNIILTFSEVVDVESGNILIKKTSDNSTVESIDVTSNQVTGSGSTQITVNPSSDLDSSTQYYLQIPGTAFDDSSSNSFAGITDTTSISFTTLSPAYTISPSSTLINEGSTLTTSISTTNVAAGTTLYWSLSGTGITSDDFSSGALTGSGNVGSDGSLSFSHALANDVTTEGSETLNIKLFSDSSRSTQVGSTSTVSIGDTSKTLSPAYTISPSSTLINEGSTLTTSISTTNVAAGTTLYWSLSGTGITSDDFSSGALTGSGNVGSDGSLSFSHALANDVTTEGSETLNIKLFSDSSRSTQVGSTSTVSIGDTSKTPSTNFTGTLGDDTFISGSDNDLIIGDFGIDTVIYSGNFKDYSFKRGSDSLEITDLRTGTNNGIDTLKEIELLQFIDQKIEESKVDIVKTYSGNFSDYKFYNKGNGIYQIKTNSGYDDITGLPLLTFTGEATTSSFKNISAIVDIKGTFDQVTGLNTDDAKMFRLYNASFKRLPDADGLKYWIGKYTSGENDERAVAQSFLISDEFKERYGENVSDSTYVNNLYKNVLGRDADTSGLNYWLGQLNTGAETRYEVLLGFSESAENKTLFTEMTGFG